MFNSVSLCNKVLPPSLPLCLSVCLFLFAPWQDGVGLEDEGLGGSGAGCVSFSFFFLFFFFFFRFFFVFLSFFYFLLSAILNLFSHALPVVRGGTTFPSQFSLRPLFPSLGSSGLLFSYASPRSEPCLLMACENAGSAETRTGCGVRLQMIIIQVAIVRGRCMSPLFLCTRKGRLFDPLGPSRRRLWFASFTPGASTERFVIQALKRRCCCCCCCCCCCLVQDIDTKGTKTLSVMLWFYCERGAWWCYCVRQPTDVHTVRCRVLSLCLTAYWCSLCEM